MQRAHWENFLRLNGIEYGIEEDSTWRPSIDGEPANVYSYIKLNEGDEKVTGYAWSYVAIFFDVNNEFLGIGAWE